MPEAGRWETFGSGSEVLKAFGPECPGSCTPCVFPLPLEGQQCKVGNKPSQNPAKSLETTQKNEVKWTLFIWLSLSGFWRWNVTICEIYETFLGITCVLPRSTVANYKQCTSSNSVSNNWRHAASNPQGCLPVIGHMSWVDNNSPYTTYLGWKCTKLHRRLWRIQHLALWSLFRYRPLFRNTKSSIV